ncbi:hypothetical protein [Dielma fastidiosa]|uniref:Uncharacterized protein n=1 Tax=Dielma fastidiosa TaxID=1034346 RepID=A0AB35UKS0_9FIRM|nr:hypothetical protein [Dielma fastidiosa]MDY5167963.1 hypothetical protein [Dielma fastidiosa]
MIKHAAAYREHKPAFEQYEKSADKEKFLRCQESSIIFFESSVKALKQVVQKLPNTIALQAEQDMHVAEKQNEYTEYQKIRSQAKEIETIKRNEDSILEIKGNCKKEYFEI